MYSKIVGKENTENVPINPPTRNMSGKENHYLASENGRAKKLTDNNSEVTIPVEILEALRSQNQEIPYFCV